MKNGYLVGFGEVMLRLCPPERKRFAQALPGQLEATFGGGEANVCASLAMLGAKSRYLTALPENPVSAAFAAQLRGLKVDVDHILYTKSGRMGVYYAEHGAAQRGSNVVYDRENSVISLLGPEAYDFPSMLENAAHLHITGITPSLSEKAYLTTLELVKYASSQGINISCDLNFRKKLWKWRPGTAPRELAAECMGKIVPYVNWIICNEETPPTSSASRAKAVRSKREKSTRKATAVWPAACWNDSRRRSMSRSRCVKAIRPITTTGARCSTAARKAKRSSRRTTRTANTIPTRSGTSWTGSAAATPSVRD